MKLLMIFIFFNSTVITTIFTTFSYTATPDLDMSGRVSKLMPDVERCLQFAKDEQKAKALENRLRNHMQKLGKSMDLVEHLRGEMIGMFKRSKIPEIERPKYKLPVLQEEVIFYKSKKYY